MEFHLSARRIRAGTRGGALAVSGYITGRSSIDGVRVNNPHRAEEIALTGLVLPAGSMIRTGAELWRTADLAERKKDGQYRRNGGHDPILASHADVAVPWGITEEKVQTIIDRICRYLVEEHKVGVEFAVHKRSGKIDHVHLLWSTRTIGPSGMGAKARGLNAIAQRQKGKGDPSAMERIREIASIAIRDSCGVNWDHRSFKRRGLDTIAEPKLDRRKLREQRRRLEQLGQSGPTQVEHELNLLRSKKSEDRRYGPTPETGAGNLGNKSLFEVAFEMSTEWNAQIAKVENVRQKSLIKAIHAERNFVDDWIEHQIQHTLRCKIEEGTPKSGKTRQWVAQIDPPNFNPDNVGPDYPVYSSVCEKRAIETVLYARKNRDIKLAGHALILLAILTKRTKQYVQWQMKCYEHCLGRGAGLFMFIDKPFKSVEECIKEMDKIPHARIKPNNTGDGMVIERLPWRTTRGIGIGE